MSSYQWWMPPRRADARAEAQVGAQADSEAGTEPGSEASGTLLSHRWVQAFVYKLPPLRARELEPSLRYKVQATLPIKIDDLAFHTRVFRHRKQTCGAAFLESGEARESLPAAAKDLRVGVPLVLPPSLPARTLLFVSTPDGLAPYYYEEGLLTTSFAPIDPQDAAIRERVLARCPEAVIVGLAPDPRFPLPDGLSEKEPAEGLRKEILGSFPLLEARPPRRYPLVAGSVLLAAGLACCILALVGSWSARAARNLAWKAWLARAEAAAALPASRDQPAALLSAQGAPVPELFFRLSRAWGTDTRIVDLEWKQGKLTLVATSGSGLASVRQLTADPWFQGLRVDEIRTQKDGTEILTVEGAPKIDH